MDHFRKYIISASRRTDIPAFYMEWMMARIDAGRFEIVNPYNRKVRQIEVTPEKVHSIVFWSKNYSPFIDGRYGESLIRAGYNLYFQFTLNSESFLEPRVPTVSERMEQMAYLCDRFGPDCIDWRFDPICHYHYGDGPVQDNLQDFETILKKVSGLGIKRCIVSFMDHYRKIDQRTALVKDLKFIDPSLKNKCSIILQLQSRLTEHDMQLFLCCEKEAMEALPLLSGVQGSTCIPVSRLKLLYGGGISMRRDSGQRVKSGCGCGVSVDIGVYNQHPCFHNCLFCYANPSGTLPPR